MRRFITKSEIDALVDQGIDVIEVDDSLTVTDIAREHARQRGVRIVRVEKAAAAADAGTLPPGVLRASVRKAVISRLGVEPPDLDRVIERVLRAEGQ
jgi:hypothetical protein